MLTKFCLCCFVMAALYGEACSQAKAQAISVPNSIPVVEVKPRPIRLMLDAGQKEDYSYRKKNYDKTVSIMLFGFRDQPDTPTIQKSRKSLGGFFKQHLDRIKEDYFSKDAGSVQLMAGDRAFNSTEINRGISTDPAKMVGFTSPYGNLTFGGGYTWGEKNPALMRRTKAEGYFTGISYDTKRVGYQLSYLKSGDRVAGVKMGGSTIQYSSLMLGTSFRITERLGMTATVQYRKDADELTTGERQAIFTVGTKWKF